MNPCLNIIIREPNFPFKNLVNTEIKTKDIWETEEKATIFFKSLWTQQIILVNKAPQNPRVIHHFSLEIKIWFKRINPKVPNFNINLAKIMEPIIGLSTWAKGSQIWNIKTGIFTKKIKIIIIVKKSCNFKNFKIKKFIE